MQHSTVALRTVRDFQDRISADKVLETDQAPKVKLAMSILERAKSQKPAEVIVESPRKVPHTPFIYA
jgi:hypothetical protein